MTTLFWDRNIGTTIPLALRRLSPPGVSIRFYQEEYLSAASAPELGDDAWLADVGEKGWFVVTQDQRLHINAPELEAIKQHNVGCFYLKGASDSRWDIFRRFVCSFDRIIGVAEDTPGPFVYRIQRTGNLRRITLP